MGWALLSGCNNSASVEKKADSLSKKVDSFGKKVWDSGKKDVKELEKKIRDKFESKDSAKK